MTLRKYTPPRTAREHLARVLEGLDIAAALDARRFLLHHHAASSQFPTPYAPFRPDPASIPPPPKQPLKVEVPITDQGRVVRHVWGGETDRVILKYDLKRAVTLVQTNADDEQAALRGEAKTFEQGPVRTLDLHISALGPVRTPAENNKETP